MAEQRTELTLDRYFHRWLIGEGRRNKNRDDYLRVWDSRCKPIQKLRATKLKYDHLFEIHASMHDVPSQANFMLVVVSRALRAAQQDGVIPPGDTVVSLVKRYKLAPRRVFLTLPEVKMLLQSLDLSTTFGVLVRELVLTGARRSELENASWLEVVEFDDGPEVLEVPASRSKTGKPRTIHITKEFYEVLHAQHNASQPFRSSMNDKHWQALRKDLGMDHLKLHDLRRIVGTVALSELGQHVETVSNMLGHADVKTTSIYVQVEAAQAGELARLVQDHILS